MQWGCTAYSSHKLWCLCSVSQGKQGALFSLKTHLKEALVQKVTFPYMIIQRQTAEGAKHKTSDTHFLGTKLIPYWLLPLPDQELKTSNSSGAGGCARVWELEHPCFAKCFCFRMCFEAILSGPTPGRISWDCLTVQIHCWLQVSMVLGVGWWWLWTYPDTETEHQKNGLEGILSVSGNRWREADDCCFCLTHRGKATELPWIEKPVEHLSS